MRIRATYRLQLTPAFRFEDAVRVVPYLARLGVSHVYCSPLLRARRGSEHGYDVVDHRAFNPELGGEEGFRLLSQALRDHGLGLLFDVVPNHMGVFGDDNEWWMDVLEHGMASSYARYFDIDWHPASPELQCKVLAPVLGDHYGAILERGELRVVFEPDRGGFAVRYHGHRFPVDPRDYPNLLAPLGEPAAGISREFAALPARDAPAPRGERAKRAGAIKARLAQLAREGGALAALGESAANASAADSLHELLERQAYRLTFWKVAADEVNYRRFFDINGLAAMRMEEREVFEATHERVLALAAEGLVDGLRIDHPDGLFDPREYFDRLQEGYARRARVAVAKAPGERPARPLYVVVEKITASHEDLPEDWAVHGTTGYRFASVVNGLFVDTAAGSRFDRIWQSFTGVTDTFEELAYSGRRAIQSSALASELTVLSTELLRIARADRAWRDLTFNALRDALRQVAACMPVYRTYITGPSTEQDRRYVDWAIAAARHHSRETDPSVFTFVREALMGGAPAASPREHAARVLRFAMRFQQYTSPVAAKGVEDTAFYNYLRLASLNEVGGDPSVFGIGVRAFHGASADRAARWPHTMLATSTHDNKRSEDVRSRIDVLSEMPAAWRLALRRWSAMNRSRRRPIDGRPAPSRADEYLFYQTVIGTLPAEARGAALVSYRERIAQYMVKAAREAKARTSWIGPNREYEQALADFVAAALDDTAHHPFLEDLRVLAATVARFGALNSLAMAAIKFTSPGVPDIYQGNEVIDLSLVDPDNRRAVDFVARERLLAQFESAPPDHFATLLSEPADGRAKAWITWRLLELRRRIPQLFAEGDYRGLAARGSRAGHVVAYRRSQGANTLLVVTGRLFAKLLGTRQALPDRECWGDTMLELPASRAPGRLVNVLTGESLEPAGRSIPLAQLLPGLPAAVLVGTAGA